MKTMVYSSNPSQPLQSSACSWIGHMNTGHIDHSAGQIFQCLDEARLECIDVYSTTVAHPGKVVLTLHKFDKDRKQWGPVITTAEVNVDKEDANAWVHFDIPAVPVHKDDVYGFRLQSKEALVGLSELVLTEANPEVYNAEWHLDSKQQEDLYYNYLSLAYKVGVRA